MSWVLLSICSALFLGFYDLAKKHAVRDNAVLPVLFFGILTSQGNLPDRAVSRDSADLS
jgi:hypothetical protein